MPPQLTRLAFSMLLNKIIKKINELVRILHYSYKERWGTCTDGHAPEREWNMNDWRSCKGCGEKIRYDMDSRRWIIA